MGKRDKLSAVFCRRCNGCHPEGEHLAKPKKAPAPKIVAAGTTTVDKAGAVVDQVVCRTPEELAAALDLPKSTAKKWRKRVGKAMEQVMGAVIDAAAADPSVAAAIEADNERMLDGVALKSVAHPRGRKKMTSQEICAEALENMPSPPSVVAVIDRLGPKEIAKRKAAKKKRTKAEALALVEAEAARKRALKTARQTRWRNKQRKKAKKK